ncbi:MAG TPA: hypothetical protein VJ859_13935 [Allosphingosinicella sp.]|nr:hypothetical protein [Allosphingosinicella sp.]
MVRAFRRQGLGAGLFLLAGCVGQVVPVSAPRPVPAPPSYSVAGLEGVMGRDARALEGQFGRPQLDIREGNARKLQFASGICVLDLYLYPPARGGEAVVTYVDARLPDGRDMDRASCVAALMKKQEGQ